MIKANDVGFEKADYTQDVFADARKQHEEFIRFVIDKTEQRAFDELNEQMQHTIPQLSGLMRYKAKHIKAHVNPYIFIEVADMLEALQKELSKYRQDKIYTEEDL